MVLLTALLQISLPKPNIRHLSHSHPRGTELLGNSWVMRELQLTTSEAINPTHSLIQAIESERSLK